MSGIGPALDPGDLGVAATPAPRDSAPAAMRVIADPAATRTTPAASASPQTAATNAPVAAAPAAGEPARSTPQAVAPSTVDPEAFPDSATAPLTPAAPTNAVPTNAVPAAATPSTATAAPASTATAAAKSVSTVQTPAARPAASPADAGSLGGLVASLLLIVGLILALGWLARRMPGFGSGGASKNGLRVVASAPVGARERVVVVEVGDTQLLLGVGAGGVRTLHTLDTPLPESTSGAPSPFAQVLAQHFGKKA